MEIVSKRQLRIHYIVLSCFDAGPINEFVVLNPIRQVMKRIERLIEVDVESFDLKQKPHASVTDYVYTITIIPREMLVFATLITLIRHLSAVLRY